MKSLSLKYVCIALVLFGSTTLLAEMVPGDLQYERLDGDPSEMETFPPAIFPHWIHRINYRCDACHDSLFEMQQGVTPVSKALMKEGKVCGACHNGKLAFSAGFENCNRCHVPAAK